jgi:thiol-disulfide isomerase/thioredoxin
VQSSEVKLADLKGKYVLLEFWGYWCGPCVHSMPVLIELHEKFADKGLAIVGVHVDIDGEVDTPAKYDEKIAAIQKKLWQGKSLPFPVVLTSGKRMETSDHDLIRGGAAGQYGILGYPTTILVDREGKVVGKFHARDAKKAIAEVEKLLSEKK